MRRIAFLVLALSLISAANAQQANFNYLGNQTTVTVATANSFANPLPQQNGRQSCIIQYRPVGLTGNAQTAPSIGFVFFGPTAPSVTTTSFVLVALQTITCENSNEIDGNAVWLSSTNTNDTFTIKVK